LLWDDCITEPEQKSPSPAARIKKKEAAFIFNVTNSIRDP